ncbi:MAG: hypothetical protein LBR12_02655, partial [Opitutaceae bacterium]|nr:hypothetical protein [Opitutaceae bacterium]
AAAGRGQLEACALWCNLTPLASLADLAQLLAPAARLRRDPGLPVTAAMNSDVNGFPWALTDLLLDSGVTALTMSINEHFGNAPRPFPGLFRWRTPTGRELPVLSGPTYAHSAWLGVAGDLPLAFEKLTRFIHRQKTAHAWPHDWYYMQLTHHGPQNDNMGPVRHLSEWVREFNNRHGDRILIRLTTPSLFFKTIAAAIPAAPLRSGEWHDWWAFGEASTPHETALHRRAAARLAEHDLHAPATRSPHRRELRAETFNNLAHYIEHTWGADCSVHAHKSPDALLGNAHKAAFAVNAFSLARLLRRDALSSLAARINTAPAPETPALLLLNPTPFSRSETLRLPRRLLTSHHIPAPASILTSTRQTGAGDIGGPFQALRFDPVPRWPEDPSYQHLVDRDLWNGAETEEVTVTLPPYGWTTRIPDPDAAVRPENAIGTAAFQGPAGQAAAAAPRNTAASTAASLDTPDLRIGSARATAITNGSLTLAVLPDRPGLARLSTPARDWTALFLLPPNGDEPAGAVAPFTLFLETLDGPHASLMAFDDTETPVETRKPVWRPDPPLTRRPATLLSNTLVRTPLTLSIVQKLRLDHAPLPNPALPSARKNAAGPLAPLPCADFASIEFTLDTANPDRLAVTLTLDKAADPRPHSLVLAVPLNLSCARVLLDMPGAVTAPLRESLPNNCPWYSIQNAFSMDDSARGAVFTTPDAPMVFFNTLPLPPEIPRTPPSFPPAPATAFLWLYTNYWETNFKADASGPLRYRFTLRLSETPPTAADLLREGALAAHPVAFHPLPQTDPFAPPPERPLPPSGQLFRLAAAHTQLSLLPPPGDGSLSDAAGASFRVLLDNPADVPDTLALSSDLTPFAAAQALRPDGSLSGGKQPLPGGVLRLTLPPRTSAHTLLFAAS